MLALLPFVVVARRVPCLHALRVLRGVWQSEQLLLQLRRDIHAGEVGSLRPHADLLAGLVAQKYALVRRGTRVVDALDRCGVAASRVDSEGTVDVAARLVELNGLPRVLRGLADARSFDNALVLLGVVAFQIRGMNIPLYLILTESKRQIELEGLIVLA